ncbi:MAG: hypothetical protein AAGG44_20920 [Planctomycetota bacterium]
MTCEKSKRELNVAAFFNSELFESSQTRPAIQPNIKKRQANEQGYRNGLCGITKVPLHPKDTSWMLGVLQQKHVGLTRGDNTTRYV